MPPGRAAAPRRDRRGDARERGSAGVEHAALALLAAALAIATVAAARLLGEGDPTPDLVSALARKQRCAVRYPDPCWRDPLIEAYGRRLAGAVRALAPAPVAVEGLVGVDYRRCRQARCATPLPGAAGRRLTASNRRTTAFTSVTPRAGGGVGIDYWTYRPTIGWERQRRVVAAAAELDRYRAVPLLESANPRLVPLETLLGREEARFGPGEQPPWRGRIESRWGRGPVSMSAPDRGWRIGGKGVARWQTSRR